MGKRKSLLATNLPIHVVLDVYILHTNPKFDGKKVKVNYKK